MPKDNKDNNDGKDGKDGKPRRRSVELGYLSTHPATEERIRAAEEAAR